MVLEFEFDAPLDKIMVLSCISSYVSFIAFISPLTLRLPRTLKSELTVIELLEVV